VALDILFIDPERRRHRILYRLWVLGRRVNYDLAIFELSHRGRRLHRSV